ncbi:HAD-IB family hydrolase [Shewanella corallii]|uniref:HAD-IB family hydrolase n=1 Tax=Shewanella corallii TaxID=560080 RepID=A0ABT0N1Q4_9GAMM|nr:HAD-IB family hydrolase [Shewanella corallii]MCL2912373.1 HAD-IB family hydrolase [Shewanella corallii]
MDLALFDFDGTITDTDTFSTFIQLTTSKRRKLAFALPLLAAKWGYKSGLMSATRARHIALKYALGNRDASAMRDLGELYAQTLLPGFIRPEAQQAMEWHRQRGDTLVLVSASLDLYLQPWTRTQGIELICSRVEICDDRLTGHYRGADCCAGEKAKRILQTYDLKEFGAVHAYGDTNEDREMLALADHAWMAWRQVKQSDNSESLTL